MAEELKITFTGGDEELGSDMTVPLAEPILVGRSRSAQIRLLEDDVSGRHLRITREADGVWVENLSRSSRTLANGKVFPTGERRRLAVGDVFKMGQKASFRIDAAGAPQPAESKDAPSLTRATRALDEMTAPMGDEPSGAVATRMAETDTFATRVAESGTVATRAATGSGDESSTADVIIASAAPLADVIASSKADEMTGTGTGAEEPETEAVETDTRTGSFPDAGADTDSNPMSGDVPSGVTRDLKTRGGDPELWERIKWIQNQRKRFRQMLLTLASMLFLGLLGVIIWMQWPKKEMILTAPKVSGSEEYDVGTYAVKNESGEIFIVDFPRDDRMKKTELPEGAGVEVLSFTGRDRDVPFRLKASCASSADELTLSLAESAAAKKAQLAAQEGYTFLSPAEWMAGEHFFESEYAGSCHSPRLLRGSRFHRSEYTVTRGGRKWHGVLLLFRDGETVYQLLHEIPEMEWVRGKYLLRGDPNLEFYPAFLAARWESPGLSGIVREADVRRLLADVSAELDFPQPRVANWPLVTRWLDTLMVRTWSAGADERKRVRDLYRRFWKQRDDKYVYFRDQFELAKTLGGDGRDRMRSVRDDCRRVFGQDATDRRFELINDPENWSCQEEQ